MNIHLGHLNSVSDHLRQLFVDCAFEVIDRLENGKKVTALDTREIAERFAPADDDQLVQLLFEDPSLGFLPLDCEDLAFNTIFDQIRHTTVYELDRALYRFVEHNVSSDER